MDKKITDYIKDDIAVVNEDGTEVKLFPSTVDEQVYVPSGINGPNTTLDAELEFLRKKQNINALNEKDEETINNITYEGELLVDHGDAPSEVSHFRTLIAGNDKIVYFINHPSGNNYNQRIYKVGLNNDAKNFEIEYVGVVKAPDDEEQRLQYNLFMQSRLEFYRTGVTNACVIGDHFIKYSIQVLVYDEVFKRYEYYFVTQDINLKTLRSENFKVYKQNDVFNKNYAPRGWCNANSGNKKLVVGNTSEYTTFSTTYHLSFSFLDENNEISDPIELVGVDGSRLALRGFYHIEPIPDHENEYFLITTKSQNNCYITYRIYADEHIVKVISESLIDKEMMFPASTGSSSSENYSCAFRRTSNVPGKLGELYRIGGYCVTTELGGNTNINFIQKCDVSLVDGKLVFGPKKDLSALYRGGLTANSLVCQTNEGLVLYGGYSIWQSPTTIISTPHRKLSIIRNELKDKDFNTTTCFVNQFVAAPTNQLPITAVEGFQAYDLTKKSPTWWNGMSWEYPVMDLDLVSYKPSPYKQSDTIEKIEMIISYGDYIFMDTHYDKNKQLIYYVRAYVNKSSCMFIYDVVNHKYFRNELSLYYNESSSTTTSEFIIAYEEAENCLYLFGNQTTPSITSSTLGFWFSKVPMSDCKAETPIFIKIDSSLYSRYKYMKFVSAVYSPKESLVYLFGTTRDSSSGINGYALPFYMVYDPQTKTICSHGDVFTTSNLAKYTQSSSLDMKAYLDKDGNPSVAIYFFDKKIRKDIVVIQTFTNQEPSRDQISVELERPISSSSYDDYFYHKIMVNDLYGGFILKRGVKNLAISAKPNDRVRYYYFSLLVELPNGSYEETSYSDLLPELDESGLHQIISPNMIQTEYGMIITNGGVLDTYIPSSGTAYAKMFPNTYFIRINNTQLSQTRLETAPRKPERLMPFVTARSDYLPVEAEIGMCVYDLDNKKPRWWNGVTWETYPTTLSNPSEPPQQNGNFETDWGSLETPGVSQIIEEDLSAPTFDIGDWTTTTLNGEPVIKSKKITSSQSTELTVTLTNITSLTIGLRASSESNYDKFYFHLNDEQMFYLTGDGTTKQETYADLDSSQSYKLKFVYTKDSSIDKFDDCGYITKIEYTQPSTSNEENNPIEVQMVRGYDSSIQGYTGKDGQLVYNQTTKRLHTMNGATRGGHPLALLSDVPTIPSTYDATKITLSSSNFTSSHVKGALDELFQSVDNGKTLIASAITDKGVETSKSDTFEVMAENIENIQTFDPDASDFYPGGNDFTFKSRTDKAAIQELYSTNEDRVFDSFNYKYNGGTTQNISLTYPLIAMNGVYNSYEWPNLYHERIGTITESKYIVNQMKITDLYNRTWASDRKYMLVSDSENGDVYCITYNQIYSATSKSGNKGYTTISRVNKDDFTLEKIGERPGCRTRGSQSFFKVGVYDHKIFFIDGYEMQWAKHPDNPTSGIGEYHNILAFDLIERCWVNYGELPTACYNPRVFAYDGWLYLLNYANKSTSYKIYNENVFSCRINLKTKAMESLDNFVTSTDSFSSSKISLSNVIHLGDQYYLMYLLDVGVAVLDAKTYTYQTSSSDNPYNGWTLGGVSRTYGSLLAFTYSQTWFTKGDYCYVGGYKFQIDKESKTFNVIAHNDAIDPLTFFHVTRNNKNYIYWMDPQWTYMARCEDEDFGNVEWLVEEDGFHPSSVYLVATEAGGESNYIAVHQAVYIVPEDVYDDYYDREFYKGTFVKSYVNVQLYDLNNHKPVNIINGDASIMDNYLWLEKDINGKNIITLKYTLRLHKDRIYFFFYSTSVTYTNHNRTVIYDIKTQKWSAHPYTFPMSGKTTQIIRDIFSNFQRWNDQLIACSYAYNIYVMENETGQWTDTGILLPNDGAKDPLGVYKDKLFYQYNGMRDTYIGYIDLNTGEFNNTWVKTACNRDYTSNYADGRYIYIMNGRGTGFQNTGIGWGELNFGEILDCETGEMKLFHPSSASLEGRGLIVKNKNTIYHILPGNGPASSSSYGTTTSWVDTYHLTEDGQTNPASTWRYSPSIKPTSNLFVLYSTVAPRLAMGDNKVFLFKGQFRNLIDSVEDNNKVTYSKKAMVSYDVDTMEFKRYADITGADDLNIDSILLYSTGKNVYYEGYIYFISSYPSYAIYRIDVSTSVLTKVHEPTAFTPPVLLGINNNKIYYYRASSAGIAYYDLNTQTETLKAISTYIFSNDSNQKYYVSMSNTHIYVNKVTTASNSETPLLTTVVYDLATWNTRKVTDVKIERGTVITEIYDENFFVVNNDIYVGVYRSPLIPTEMKHPEIYSGRDANIVYIYRFDTTTFAWSIVSYVPYVLASEFFSDGKRIFAVGSHSDSKSVACSMITELTLQTKSYFSVLPNGGNTITLTNALPDIPVNVGKGRLQCIDDPAIELYIK